MTDRPTPEQRDASDARHSVFVTASAGAGKTKVLIDRVLALMLAGSRPDRILCLTFTKAAAAEMANRLHERLSRWATEEEGVLALELQQLLGRAVDTGARGAARRLFVQVLDTPGGLKIETIHAFCQSLLRRFPAEAGVAPHFELMDERGSSELLASVREQVLVSARRGDDPDLGAALTLVAQRLREQGFFDLLEEITGARRRFRDIARNVPAALSGMAAKLGVAPGASGDQVVEAACAEDAFDGVGLRRAAEILCRSKAKTDRKYGQVLADWLAAPESRAANFDAYLAVYFTQKGDRRDKLVTKSVAAASPEVPQALERETERLEEVRQRRAAADLWQSSAAVIRLATAILAAYERHKQRSAVLDYDDLVAKSVDLLERDGLAQWVLYKLDGGIDHLLIDEAQDTNPDQWRIVQALTGEFFSGAGAHDSARTVFAVGDAKQSIFSFQGADPQAFLAMRSYFAERAMAAATPLRQVTLETSFRSTAAVLAAVDSVFAGAEAGNGVALDGLPIRHQAHRQGHAGHVEIWPLIEWPSSTEAEKWQLPVGQNSPVEPQIRLARGIAATIKRWLDTGETLPARGRRIRPGDIMILVRRRGSFAAAMVRALKDYDVAVAGADRMRLTEQLAVEDMIALGQFLLLPEDDLILATVLKGPLFNWDEDQLYALAQGHDPGRLWQDLRRRENENPLFAATVETLSALLARADFVPPYELYTEVLGPLGGRRKILERLGPEAADPLDEFLAAAVAYEEDHRPSLQGFLHWLAAGAAEIKRDFDPGRRDEVRVLTVHGAKGLEAPIVFLPDTTQVPARADSLQWAEDGYPLWPVFAHTQVPAAAAARQAELARQGEEYRRLLYVALTRAADRLYICGWRPRKPRAGLCWYELIRRGLAAAPGIPTAAMDFTPLLGAEGWSGDGLVLAGEQTIAPADDRTPLAVARTIAPLAPWATTPPKPEPAPPRPLAPSRPSGVEPAARSPLTGEGGDAFRRGRLVHRLLQSLPDLPRHRWREAAGRFLALPIHGLPEEERVSIAAETLAVLEQPDFAPLFGPGSKAEIPIVGLIGNRALAGRIDRLVVTDRLVQIVDFKTLRPVPPSANEVPALYLDQLAAYAGALAGIYPGKEIRAALLWTEGPQLMPIGADLLAGRIAAGHMPEGGTS